MTAPFARLSRFAHPRLTVLTIAGTGVGLVGLVLFLTAASVGHGLESTGMRLGIFGALVAAFGASGLVAFTAFERGFD